MAAPSCTCPASPKAISTLASRSVIIGVALGHPLKRFVFQRFLDGANLSHCGGKTA
jgi:hypothetical protein